MNAREHDIDRVARAMTAGAPGGTFAARVMAPLHGAPQPGFTSRVMSQVDARPRAGLTRAVRPVLAAAVAVALLAMLWLPSRAPLPALPAPGLGTAAIGEPAFDLTGPRPGDPPGTTRTTARERSTRTLPPAPVRAAAVMPDAGRPLYRIAELESPAELAIAAIAPAPPAVAPLDRPAALIVPGLRFEKEKP